MDEELQQLINNWQEGNNQLGDNNVKPLDNSFKDGEFTFLLTKSIDLNHIQIPERIEVSRIFGTLAQNDETINANGDTHNFNRLVENIEREFADELSATIKEYI